MHKQGTLNLIYIYDVKLKYFYIQHDFYINFTSQLSIKLIYNALMFFKNLLYCNLI